MTQGVIAAFARGRSTADLSGTSTGTLHLDLARQHASVQASARGEGHGWDAFDPRLADLGSLTFGVDVDVEADRESVNVRKAEAGIQSAAHGEVLRIAALQALRFELAGPGSSSPRSPASPRCASPRRTFHCPCCQGFVPAARFEGGPCRAARSKSCATRSARRLLVARPLKDDGCGAAAPFRRCRPPAIRRDVRPPRDPQRRGAREPRSRSLRSPRAPGFVVRVQGSARRPRATLSLW